MGVPLGSGGNGISGDPPHRGIHQETAGNHSGKDGMPLRILALHGGGEDAGDESDSVMVGPVCVK